MQKRTASLMSKTKKTFPLAGLWDNGVHSYRTRIYYDKTDAAGLVYHAEYLCMAEQARTESLRSLGLFQRSLFKTDGIVLTVRHCSIDFKRPAFLDDLIEVKTRFKRIAGARVFLAQDISCVEENLDQTKFLVGMEFQIACVKRCGRPTRFPENLRLTISNIINAN